MTHKRELTVKHISCRYTTIWQKTLSILVAVHKCQHFHECTNYTLSETPFPPQKKEYTSTFF